MIPYKVDENGVKYRSLYSFTDRVEAGCGFPIDNIIDIEDFFLCITGEISEYLTKVLNPFDTKEHTLSLVLYEARFTEWDEYGDPLHDEWGKLEWVKIASIWESP